MSGRSLTSMSKAVLKLEYSSDRVTHVAKSNGFRTGSSINVQCSSQISTFSRSNGLVTDISCRNSGNISYYKHVSAGSSASDVSITYLKQ